MKLYELSGEYERARQWLDDNPGADAAEVDAYLESIGHDAEAKVESIGILTQEMRREADMFKAEETRLRERRQATENRRERLLDYLRREMPRLGITKVAGRVTVRIQDGKPSIGAVDVAHVDGQWLTPQEPSVKKRELLAHYKATGEIPEGVEIVTGPDCVVIR